MSNNNTKDTTDATTITTKATTMATTTVTTTTTTISSTSIPYPSSLDDSTYTKEGLDLWLNNMPERSEEHFKCALDSTPIFAGYAFVVSMNGVISYEMDKITEAQQLLKELERRCHQSISNSHTSSNINTITTTSTPTSSLSPGNWLNSFRYRLFGNTMTPTSNFQSNTSATATIARSIEEQIILADTFLSSAILTFLTQDITGLMRGSWLLRKAWKIYQTTYTQLYEMFMLKYGNGVGDDGDNDNENSGVKDVNILPPKPSNYQSKSSVIRRSKSEYSCNDEKPTRSSLFSHSRSFNSNHSQLPEDVEFSVTTKPKIEALKCDQHKSNSNTISILNNLTLTTPSTPPPSPPPSAPPPSTSSKLNILAPPSPNPSTASSKILFIDDDTDLVDDNNHNLTIKSTIPLATPSVTPSKQHLHLDLINTTTITTTTTSQNKLYQQVPLSCPPTNPTVSSELSDSITNTTSTAANNIHYKKTLFSKHKSSEPSQKNLDPDIVKRLMGAVSFGYGIFQLSASLLPISLLRIISFFGFEGNRSLGISCLMFARLSTDMRAPLASLALLWFYTFGSQMLKYEDGYTADETEAAANLIMECQKDYINSAIFLFFRGRVERMKATTEVALQSYQLAYKYSAQKELRLLCMHEIAWCRLIQLDFHNAQNRFNELREISVFSKAFYTYMTAICQGASGDFSNLSKFSCEIKQLLTKSKQKDSHISRFVQHRINLFPIDDNNSEINKKPHHQLTKTFWKCLVYEVLFLWNALSNASTNDLNSIANECCLVDDDADDNNKSNESLIIIEPMVGLRKLILGGTLACLKKYQDAVNAYKECIKLRKICDTTVNSSSSSSSSPQQHQPDSYNHVAAFAHYELAMLLLQCRYDYTQEAKNLLRDALNYKNYDLENRLSVHIQKELKKLG